MRRVPLFVIALVFVSRGGWSQGNPLGPEFRVNTYTTGYQLVPSAASDDAGNFVVVWSSGGQDGSYSGVFGQRYASSGVPLGPEFRVNTFTTDSQGAASVAADAAGNFVIVWTSGTQDGSGLAPGVFGQRYAGSGTPLGPEFRVNSYTPGQQFNPSVAVDSAGNFVVVWTSQDQDGAFDGVFGQRYASSGMPLGPEFRVNTFTTNEQYLQSVASDPSGNFVVAWTSTFQDGSSLGIFAQRYSSSGAPLGTEFRVNTFTPNRQSYPSVAADASGNFVVVWHSVGQDGDAFGIFGQRYASSGAPLGPEFRVNTYTTGGQLRPSVAADPAGNFVVVWDGYPQDGDGFGVFGQRYDSSGAPLGPEFIVNTHTTGYQSFPSVTSDATGNFVVVWHDDSEDGSSVGVFGQRYGQIVPVELMRMTVE